MMGPTASTRCGREDGAWRWGVMRVVRGARRTRTVAEGDQARRRGGGAPGQRVGAAGRDRRARAPAQREDGAPRGRRGGGGTPAGGAVGAEDSAQLRDAVDALERQVDASPDPDADLTRRARVEVRRVRAGLAGRPDPTAGEEGLRSGWFGLPPAVAVGIGAWLVIAAVLVIWLVAGGA